MDKNLVKQAVVNSYGKLARNTTTGMFTNLFSCCEPSKNARKVGEAVGYSDHQLKSAPKDSNLGVGCGNPSEYAKIEKGETVVDLGSGAGFDAFIVSPLVGENGHAIGVDLSPDMLTLARNNAEKGGYENVSFIEGDIEELPFNDGYADLIISNCVINLSHNKKQVYEEAFRVLKNGGRISISDIVLEKELPGFVKDSLAAHIACVSGAELLENYLKYLSNAGFHQVKIQDKKEFPLELMLADPQVQKLATEMEFHLEEDQLRDIAASVISISITASK